MRSLALALGLTLAGADVSAGAWPRAEGKLFLSFSQQTSTGGRSFASAVGDIRSYSSFYGEYGWSERLTVGLDAGYGTGEDNAAASALVFARLPVWSPGQHKVAADFGLGWITSDRDGEQLRVRPGLAWGRGFESGWGGGWLGMESSIEYRSPGSDAIFKADFTAGLKPTERWMLIGQMQTGIFPDDDKPSIRLAPSVVRRLGPRLHMQVGAILDIFGGDGIGVKASFWYED